MSIFIPGIAIPLVVALLYAFLPGIKELPWTPLRLFGAAAAGIGYALVSIARVQLGTSFAVSPQARALVTHGLYSRLRNPMYVFVDLMLLGLILVFDAPWLLVVLGILAVFQALQARREVKVLQGTFGQAYRDYARQTWF